MSRGLTSAAIAATSAEVVARTMAVQLEFADGTVRYTGAPYDLTIGGFTFSGVGMLGQVSAIEEAAELRAYGMVVSLSGIPRDVIAIALTTGYQGRRATVWEVPLGSDGLPVADPIVVFRGRMDQMDVTLGETAAVSVRLANRLADWERARVRRYNDESQKALHPTDRFFEFVPATVEKELAWPAASFFRR